MLRIGEGSSAPPGDDNRGAKRGTIALKEPYEATGGRFGRSPGPTGSSPGRLTGRCPRTHRSGLERPVAKVRELQRGLVEDTIPEDIGAVLDTTGAGRSVPDAARRGGQI